RPPEHQESTLLTSATLHFSPVSAIQSPQDLITPGHCGGLLYREMHHPSSAAGPAPPSAQFTHIGDIGRCNQLRALLRSALASRCQPVPRPKWAAYSRSFVENRTASRAGLVLCPRHICRHGRHI